jgi:hypothetical protein
MPHGKLKAYKGHEAMWQEVPSVRRSMGFRSAIAIVSGCACKQESRQSRWEMAAFPTLYV